MNSGRNWSKRMMFHAEEPSCWLDRAKAEISSRPFVETRGRKLMTISDDDRVVRGKLLRRRASVMQRLSAEMDGSVRPLKVAHMAELLESLKGEIESYGGVPKGW